MKRPDAIKAIVKSFDDLNNYLLIINESPKSFTPHERALMMAETALSTMEKLGMPGPPRPPINGKSYDLEENTNLMRAVFWFGWEPEDDFDKEVERMNKCL